MYILNIMLSRSLGGIQQSFIDYSKIILGSGFNIVNIVSAKSKIVHVLENLDLPFHTVENYFQYDLITIYRIRQYLLKYKPKFVLVHGNRALNTALLSNYFLNCKIIAIAHNYTARKINKADHVIAITQYMAQYLKNNNVDHKKISIINNSINIDQHFNEFSFLSETKKIIGTMGRFVHKKGFEIFLSAIAILKQKRTDFIVKIGGEGELEALLKEKVNKLDLNDVIKFTGWISNKKAFFASIDIFCLPSLEEPFGIIVLEAMMSCKPVISSDSEGPMEILNHEENALLYDKKNDNMLALRLEQLINDEKLCKKLVCNAYKRVTTNYSINQAVTKFKKLTQ